MVQTARLRRCGRTPRSLYRATPVRSFSRQGKDGVVAAQILLPCVVLKVIGIEALRPGLSLLCHRGRAPGRVGLFCSDAGRRRPEGYKQESCPRKGAG